MPPIFLSVNNGTRFLADIDGQRTLSALHGAEIPEVLNQQIAWTKLTRERAQKLWGEPRKRKTRPILTSFEVFGKYNEERNLYHLDINFDKSGFPSSYRVRGIGINTPK